MRDHIRPVYINRQIIALALLNELHASISMDYGHKIFF
jgi:hypothetical protein